MLKKNLRNQILGSILIALFLGGCAQMQTYKWTHPTKTETQFYTDSGNCELKAAQTYPQRYDKSHCYDPELPLCWEIDKNERVRQNYFARCMAGLGYRY